MEILQPVVIDYFSTNSYLVNISYDYIWERHLAEKSWFKCIVYKTNNKYFKIITLYECFEK